MKKRLLILFLASMVIVLSCSKKNETGDEEPSGEEVSPRLELSLNDGSSDSPESTTDKVGGQVSSPSNSTGNGVSREVTPQATILPESNQEKLSRRKRTIPIAPEDMQIGILHVGETDALLKESRGMTEVVVSFLYALVDGKVENSLFAGESSDYLKRMMEPVAEDGLFPHSFRIGTPVLGDDGCGRINIRLFGDPGRSSGEALLCLEDEDWKITDLQINFEALAEDYNKGWDVYEPRLYRWLELY
ncbi:MAG: hypothetical protein JEY99_19680 [Spirochaetales bacterium]|nr:hypothetical protein [Spirochaetales bacterium]